MTAGVKAKALAGVAELAHDLGRVLRRQVERDEQRLAQGGDAPEPAPTDAAREGGERQRAQRGPVELDRIARQARGAEFAR